MVGREDKRTNNGTIFPALKNNAAAGTVKIELLKGANWGESLSRDNVSNSLWIAVWNNSALAQPSSIFPAHRSSVLGFPMLPTHELLKIRKN